MDLFEPPDKEEMKKRKALRLAECSKTHVLQIGIVLPYGVLIVGCPDCGYVQESDKVRWPFIEGDGKDVFYPRAIHCSSIHHEYPSAMGHPYPKVKLTFEVVI